MSLVLSKTDFARALQCQPSYVTRLLHKGLIKATDEGKIDVEEALRCLRNRRRLFHDRHRTIDLDHPDSILERAQQLVKSKSVETDEEFLWSIAKLARFMGLSTKTIRRHVEEWDLPRRDDGFFDARSALKHYFHYIY